jgi:hypothetical protein
LIVKTLACVTLPCMLASQHEGSFCWEPD